MARATWLRSLLRLARDLTHEGKEPGSGRAMPTASPEEFHRLMGSWATGVTVVTSVGPHGPHGMTANAFLSVSLEPPLVLVSIGRQNDSHAIIQASRRFAISILAAGQESLSIHFAQRFKDPAQALQGIAWTQSPGGLPWLAGAIGHLECEVHDEVPAQDHTLFLGRVLHVALSGQLPPLIYFRSRYDRFR